MSVNDWGGRLAGDARKYIEAEKKGMGSIALYIARDVAPYIGMRIQEGVSWRPDSDENEKLIRQDMFQAAGVPDTKGLPKGSDAFVNTRNVQTFIRRALKLYRACCILQERTEEAPLWHQDKAPEFPLSWFVPEGKYRVASTRKPPHAPMSGKSVLYMTVEDGEGNESPHAFTISEASIIALTRPASEKGAETPQAAPATNLEGACEQLQSMLATADYKLSDKPADAFFAMLEAFIDASPDNAALVAGMAQRALASADKASVAA